MPEPTASSGDAGGSSTSEPLIFVSDASAEAERIIAMLRGRGYATVDVPLALLFSRVSVQRPALVLCDVDAPGALDAIERLREIPGGATVDVLFLGEVGRTLDVEAERIARQSSGIFVRPVDVYALLRRVEGLIGPGQGASRPSGVPQPSRLPVLVAATRRPYRYDTRARARNLPSTTIPAPPARVPEPPVPAAPPIGGVAALAAAIPTEADVLPSNAPAGLSAELSALLGRAEQRVLGSRLNVSAGERLSPEAELEAVLPEDLLAALDEPLDELDEEDDDAGTPGTHGSDSNLGSRTGSRPGQDSTSGTAPGGLANPYAARETHTGPGDREELAAPPSERAPPTPPAIPARTVPPTRTHAGMDTTGFGTLPPPSQAEPPIGDTPEPTPEPSEARQASTKPPRARPSAAVEPVAPLPKPPSPTETPSEAKPAPAEQPGEFEIRNTLRTGDSIRVLARAVRTRYSGAIAFEDTAGIRRIVFRDGDFVMAASGIEGESLVAFLTQRGDLTREAATRLGRKLPQFGRHAGAALIAQGYLRQDDLWPTLRAHAEWLITRIASLQRGDASPERVVPPRLAAEPSVFGGATGAEVLVEVVRRAVTPSDAVGWLGGPNAEIHGGNGGNLLSECALSEAELELVRNANGPLGELLEREREKLPELANVLFTLVELGVLRVRTGSKGATPRRSTKPASDAIDHEVVRARVRARRALVDEGNYFALLGVSRSATSYDIRRAYTALRKEFEPSQLLTPATADLNDDVDLVIEMLDEAYDILRDPVRRERYRRALEDSPE